MVGDAVARTPELMVADRSPEGGGRMPLMRPHPGLYTDADDAERPVVLCFPPAGANGLVFLPWAQACPCLRFVGADIRYGRSTVARAAPCDRIPALADFYVDAIRTAGISPDVLFGVSMGGILAYEMAKRLASTEDCPRLLAVAAMQSPGRLDDVRALDLGDTSLLALLKSTDSLPGGLSDDQTARLEWLLGPLRWDLEALQSYADSEITLDLEIWIVRPSNDSEMTKADEAGWLARGQSGRYLEVPGGHLAVLGPNVFPSFLDQIVRWLAITDEHDVGAVRTSG